MMGVEDASVGMRRRPGDPVLRARDEKLESLKAVAGKLAHDFNNFLVPQFGYVTLLKEELAAESGSGRYLEAMETATRRAESYIDGILTAMRPERHFTPATVSLDGVLNAALLRWHTDAPPGMMVEVNRAIEPCSIYGDQKQWNNVVSQLFANARYALATGGRLEVMLKHDKLSGEEVERLGMGTDDVVALTVRDSGFGMNGKVAQRAFDPFYTTRTQIKAAGLGLTAVHSLAQFHGGQVELESAEEKGTTVTMWIPANGFGGQAGFSVGRSGTGFTERKKVLLIEDDPLVKEVLRDWLGRMNLEVHIVANANEADAFFTRRRGELSLVITETDLKAGPGEEIHAQIAKAHGTPEVPWIFLAGRRRPEFPGPTQDGGPAPLVMQKPVTLRALAEVVRRHAGA